MVYRFCVKPTSTRLFLKAVQVTMKHNPFDAIGKFMYTLHPPCIRWIRWFLECNVKRTWTGSAFSTNEGGWSAMVMGRQSHVWICPENQGKCVMCPLWGEAEPLIRKHRQIRSNYGPEPTKDNPSQSPTKDKPPYHQVVNTTPSYLNALLLPIPSDLCIVSPT